VGVAEREDGLTNRLRDISPASSQWQARELGRRDDFKAKMRNKALLALTFSVALLSRTQFGRRLKFCAWFFNSLRV